MTRKTQVHAVKDRQEILITREFELPVDLLFKAYEDPALVEQWMGTRVLKLENRRHGSYHFQTTDPAGNHHHFSGTIHDFVPGKKIVRTFEMENTGLEPQLEFLDFEPLTGETSRLTMHLVFRSIEGRDRLMQMPFAAGINMAHNRLEEIVKSHKSQP